MSLTHFPIKLGVNHGSSLTVNSVWPANPVSGNTRQVPEDGAPFAVNETDAYAVSRDTVFST